jgi:uncharacterized protein with PIN domain
LSTASVSFQQAPTGAEAPAADPSKDINAQATNPAPTGDGSNPARPEWLPSNFNSVEDFVKSSNDARAELTRTQQELAKLRKPSDSASEKPAEGTEKAPQTEAERAASDAVATAGLDVTSWQAEFNETRDVSEKGRAEIAKALEAQFGPNARTLVDDFIEGQKVRLQNVENQVHQVAGGKDQYAAMMQWAGSNLSDQEVNAYNKAMGSGDFNAMSLAVDGLKARFVKAKGSAPNLISGDGSIGDSNAGFGSTFEMTKAMKDPRYGKDPAYTKSIEQRAMRSNF